VLVAAGNIDLAVTGSSLRLGAEPLAAAVAPVTVRRPQLGHVGTMSAVHAPDMLWMPVAKWLRARLG